MVALGRGVRSILDCLNVHNEEAGRSQEERR